MLETPIKLTREVKKLIRHYEAVHQTMEPIPHQEWFIANLGLGYFAQFYWKHLRELLPKVLADALLNEEPFDIFQYLTGDTSNYGDNCLEIKQHFKENRWFEAEDKILQFPYLAACYVISVHDNKWDEFLKDEKWHPAYRLLFSGRYKLQPPYSLDGLIPLSD